MILIVDSGSTKTDWCFADSSDVYVLVHTDGINPVVQSYDEMLSVVQKQMLPRAKQQSLDLASLDEVYFYGAGCTPELRLAVEKALRVAVDEKPSVYVDSDLLAAARALCGTDSGIACILGTGSNSCYYDGEGIKEHTPALGYILGDEGSGAVLGRNFINGILKGTLSRELRDVFFDEYHTSQADIINKVYHSAMPLEQAAMLQGYELGKILKSPLEGLLDYHFANK